MQVKKQQQNNKPLSSRQRAMYLSDIQKKVKQHITKESPYVYFKHCAQVVTPVTQVSLWGISIDNNTIYTVNYTGETKNASWNPVENKPTDDAVILVLWEKAFEIEKAAKNNSLDKVIWQ